MIKKPVLNTAANLASRMWTIAANFLFVPIYVSLLGEEAYGLVTFFTTMQTTLNLLGLGLSKTLRREFASDDCSGKSTLYKYQILRSVETIYWIIGFGIVAGVIVGSDVIAHKWLYAVALDATLISFALKLMGVSIALQLIANLYLGCLFGLEQQVLANSIQVVWSAAKHGGSAFLLAVWKADVGVFYVWHVILDALYFVILRAIVIGRLKRVQNTLTWKIEDIKNLQNVWKYAGGLLITSVGYTFNSQFDKMLISGAFPLAIVGAYNTTFSLSYVVSILGSAVGIAIFPRLTGLFTAQKSEEHNDLFIRANRFVNCFTCSLGAFVAVFAYTILAVWTQSDQIAEVMKDAAFWLILGTTLSALQEIPYNFLLSKGVTIVNSIQSLCTVVYVLIVVPAMVSRMGLQGAALAWFIEMLLSTTIYLVYIFSRYFRKQILYRLIIETYAPLLLSLGVAKALKYSFERWEFNNQILQLVCAMVGGLCCFIVMFFGVELLSEKMED